jgi:hypothetical protein
MNRIKIRLFYNLEAIYGLEQGLVPCSLWASAASQLFFVNKVLLEPYHSPGLGWLILN